MARVRNPRFQAFGTRESIERPEGRPLLYLSRRPPYAALARPGDDPPPGLPPRIPEPPKSAEGARAGGAVMPAGGVPAAPAPGGGRRLRGGRPACTAGPAPPNPASRPACGKPLHARLPAPPSELRYCGPGVERSAGVPCFRQRSASGKPLRAAARAASRLRVQRRRVRSRRVAERLAARVGSPGFLPAPLRLPALQPRGRRASIRGDAAGALPCAAGVASGRRMVEPGDVSLRPRSITPSWHSGARGTPSCARRTTLPPVGHAVRPVTLGARILRCRLGGLSTRRRLRVVGVRRVLRCSNRRCQRPRVNCRGRSRCAIPPTDPPHPHPPHRGRRSGIRRVGGIRGSESQIASDPESEPTGLRSTTTALASLGSRRTAWRSGRPAKRAPRAAGSGGPGGPCRPRRHRLVAVGNRRDPAAVRRSCRFRNCRCGTVRNPRMLTV